MCLSGAWGFKPAAVFCNILNSAPCSTDIAPRLLESGGFTYVASELEFGLVIVFNRLAMWYPKKDRAFPTLKKNAERPIGVSCPRRNRPTDFGGHDQLSKWACLDVPDAERQWKLFDGSKS